MMKVRSPSSAKKIIMKLYDAPSWKSSQNVSSWSLVLELSLLLLGSAGYAFGSYSVPDGAVAVC